MRKRCREKTPRKQGGGIGSDRHEGRMTERELPRLSHDKVQAHGKDHIDRCKEDHLGHVGIDPATARLKKNRTNQSDRETESRVFQKWRGGAGHGRVVRKGSGGWQRDSELSAKIPHFTPLPEQEAAAQIRETMDWS